MIIVTTRRLIGDNRYFCEEWYAIPSYKYDPTKLTINQYAYSEKNIPNDFYKKHAIYYVDHNQGNKLVKAYEYETNWESVSFVQGDIIGVAGTISNDKFMQYLADIINKLANRIDLLESSNTTILTELDALKEYIATHSGGTTPTPSEDDDDDATFLKQLSEIEDDFINFVSVYRSALNGIMTVSAVDPFQFVNIYDEAYLGTPDEIFSNDTYLFVSAYDNAFGGFNDVTELEILFGVGPHTFFESFMEALGTGLNNLPNFTYELPTLADLGTIDPYSVNFLDVYNAALGTDTLSGLSISEIDLPAPDRSKLFDTIFEEAYAMDDDSDVAELYALFGHDEQTFLESYTTALDNALTNLPNAPETLPTYLNTILYRTSDFLDTYNNALGTTTLNTLPVSETALPEPDHTKLFDTIYTEAYGINSGNNTTLFDRV